MQYDDQVKPGSSPPAIGAGLRTHLGEQLRRIYDMTLSEPIPARFTALIDQLDRASTSTDESPRPASVNADVEGLADDLDGSPTSLAARRNRGFEGDAR